MLLLWSGLMYELCSSWSVLLCCWGVEECRGLIVVPIIVISLSRWFLCWSWDWVFASSLSEPSPDEIVIVSCDPLVDSLSEELIVISCLLTLSDSSELSPDELSVIS